MSLATGTVEPVIAVSDLGRARAFYEGVLGLTPDDVDDEVTRFRGPAFRSVWMRDPDGNILAVGQRDDAGTERGAPIVHVEIVDPEPEELHRFYSTLFGWRFDFSTAVAAEVSDPDLYGTIPPYRVPDGTGVRCTADGSGTGRQAGPWDRARRRAETWLSAGSSTRTVTSSASPDPPQPNNTEKTP